MGILPCPVLALLLAAGLAAGADRAHPLPPWIASASGRSQPTVTVLPAPSGAALQSDAAGGASLNLGQVAYYSGGHLAPGVSAKKNHTALVLSSRFGLRVDCGAGSRSSLAEVTISLADIDPSYTVSVDGVKLSPVPSVTVLRCGSVTEHKVEIEVPKTRPAGPLGSAITFSAATKD